MMEWVNELRNKTKRKQKKTEEIEIFLWYFLGFFLCIQFGRLWQADRHVNTISHTLVLASLRSLVYIRGFSHSFMRYFTAYTCILYLSTILCGIKCIVMFDGFLLIYLFITIQKKNTKSMHYNASVYCCRVRSFLLTLLLAIHVLSVILLLLILVSHSSNCQSLWFFRYIFTHIIKRQIFRHSAQD